MHNVRMLLLCLLFLGSNYMYDDLQDKLRQPFRGSFVFPHNFGRQQRVLIFAEVSQWFVLVISVQFNIIINNMGRKSLNGTVWFLL